MLVSFYEKILHLFSLKKHFVQAPFFQSIMHSGITMELFKLVGANFRELLKYYKFIGTYFRVLFYLKRYDLKTPVNKYVEVVNSWMRGTETFNEN